MRAGQGARGTDQADRWQASGACYRRPADACPGDDGGKMIKLDGKVALVTGASRGIGQAIALGLGRSGAVVAGTSTTATGADGISRNLAGAQIRGGGWTLDVNDPRQAESVVETVQKQL